VTGKTGADGVAAEGSVGLEDTAVGIRQGGLDIAHIAYLLWREAETNKVDEDGIPARLTHQSHARDHCRTVRDNRRGRGDRQSHERSNRELFAVAHLALGLICFRQNQTVNDLGG
jgi:hypothetical protein